MEKTLNVQLKTQVKLCVSRYTKFYFDKTAMVEIVRCIVNADTGALIRQDFVQNRIFSNKGLKEYDKLLENIAAMGEEEYFKTLLDIVDKETKEA